MTSVYQVKCHSTLFVNKLLLFTRLDNIRQVNFNLKKNSSHLVIFFNLINHFILITLYCPFGSSVIIKCINTQQINKRYNLPLLSTIKRSFPILKIEVLQESMWTCVLSIGCDVYFNILCISRGFPIIFTIFD